MIESIDHFVITVADLETTLSFYERVLGMQRFITAGRPAALLFGTQKINVHQMNATFKPNARRAMPGAADFCLITQKPMSEVVEHLRRQHIPVELGPVLRNGARDCMTSVYFRDPDGNLIELSHYR